MAEVSFKVVLQHTQRRQTMHRFRGDFAYAQLMDLMSYLWGGKKQLVVEYTDEDGDNITVLTDVEWKECVRLHLEQQQRDGRVLPLCLRVCKVVPASKKKHQRNKATSENAASPNASTDTPTIPTADDGTALRRDEDDMSDSDGHEYVALSTNDGSMIKGSVASRCSDSPQDRSPSTEPTTQTTSASATTLSANVPRLHLSAINRGGSVVEAENEQDGALLHLLSIMFDCDAATELFSGNPTAQLGSLVQRRVASNGDVHLDVDIVSLSKSVVVKANQLMDTKAAESRKLLEAAVPLFREYPPITYNLACACALDGNADAAIAWLDDAIALGNREYRILMDDADLASLRNLPAFTALMRKHFPSESASTVANGSQTIEPAAPAAATAATTTATEEEADDTTTTEDGFTMVDQPASIDEAPAAAAAGPEAPVAAQPPVSVQATPVVAPDTASTVQPQQLPPPAFTPRTNTMVNIFPGMSGPEAQRLLQLANGNMNLAVQWKLGTM